MGVVNLLLQIKTCSIDHIISPLNEDYMNVSRRRCRPQFLLYVVHQPKDQEKQRTVSFHTVQRSENNWSNLSKENPSLSMLLIILSMSCCAHESTLTKHHPISSFSSAEKALQAKVTHYFQPFTRSISAKKDTMRWTLSILIASPLM